MRLARSIRPSARRTTAALSSLVLVGGGLVWNAQTALAVPACANGSTPALLSTVTCNTAGNYTFTVPAGTTTVAVDVTGAGGGAGYPNGVGGTGGNAAEVTGTLTLPAGTVYLYVIVGAGGTGGNSNAATGGGGSGILAEDSSHALLAKVAIGGGGGGGAYNGSGGNAGSPGTIVSFGGGTNTGPGQAAVGPTGGAGGAAGTSGAGQAGSPGGNNAPGALALAAGGAGGFAPSFSGNGGGGGGGYGGGGGGGSDDDDFMISETAGGGGGSSYVSSYLAAASTTIASGTGGTGVPNGAANDGTVGKVVMTFHGVTVPGAPTGVSATAGNAQASVSFTAPSSDGGSAITSYTVTSSPGGLTATCPGSPCVVTGLTNGTGYTFTVHATNGQGNSAESSASTSVTPATVPGVPTGVSATATDGQASVALTAPSANGGSAITSYTVTSAPGGLTATCPGSPCVVTGLTNGTAYTFTVHATNGVGNSAESSASTSVTPLGVPGAPTGVSATPGNTQASVAFTAPVSNGGSAITSYTVTSAPGGFTATCPGSPCVVTGLTNGTGYTFTVHATNSVGNSGESSASASVTPAVAPGAPTIGSATPDNGQASVSFTAPSSDGGSAITSYTVTSAPGGLTATCPGSPCVVTGLTNGTGYTFTVHATNSVGNSGESSATASVTPVSVPGAPTGASATPGNGQASVAFTAPADNGGLPITSYTVTSAPGGFTATCPGSPCVVTGLTNGTAYTFTVHATNSHGDSVESSASASVTPAVAPGAPTIGAATPGDGQASVAFTAPSANGGSAITSYTVTSAPGGLTATCPGSPCVVTGLTNGTAYTFTVHATNGVGNSAESAATATITPRRAPDAPSGVTVTRGNGQASVSFTAPASDGGSAIISYEYSTNNGDTWHTLTTSGTAPISGVITGLVNGTTYPVQIRAVNAAGGGAASVAVNVTPATNPGAPTAVSAIAGNGQAIVSFTAPGTNGGSAIVGYTVTSAPGGLTAACTSSPCLVTGLVNGTAYTFTAHATNAVGDSAESGASTAVTPTGPPTAPGAVTTTSTATSVSVTFAAPASDGGSAIIRYEVSTDNGATWATLTTSASGANLTGTVTGLTPGTAYPVLVRAVNAIGNGAATAAVTATTLPAPVTAPTATLGTSSTTVSWPQSTTSTVTGYTVYAQPGPATCETKSITATSCVIGATAGVSYTYTVVAHSPAGDSVASPASEATTTVTAPPVPTSAPLDAATTLTTTDGVLSSVDPGQQITVVGTGFLANSSVSIIIYSSPVTLATVTTDASGNFSQLVTLPSSLEAGAHNLVASGVDPSGATHLIRMPVTYTASAAAGTTGDLASTGFPAVQVLLWDLLTVTAGALLIRYARRRRPSVARIVK